MSFITRTLLITFLGLSLIGSPASAMNQEIISCKNMSKEALIMGINGLPLDLKRYIISLLIEHCVSFHFKLHKGFILERKDPLSLAFSPDGGNFILGDSSWIMFCNIYTGGKSGRFFPRDLQLTSVACSVNGETCLMGFETGRACLWKPTNNQLIHLRGHTERIKCAAFTLDGERVATGSFDKTASLWNAKTGAFIEAFRGYDYVNSVAFSPDGETLCTGSADGTACLWDYKTGEWLQHVLNGHTDSVNSVAFSPDGQTCCTGSDDGTACLWNSESGKLLQTFKGHHHAIMAVGFVFDGETVITNSADNKVCIWSCKTGECIVNSTRPNNGFDLIAFSPAGDTSLTTGQGDDEREDQTLLIFNYVYGFNCLTKKKKEKAFKQFLTFYPLLQKAHTAVADEQKNNSDSSGSLTCIQKEEKHVDREEINSEQERESTTEEKESSLKRKDREDLPTQPENSFSSVVDSLSCSEFISSLSTSVSSFSMQVRLLEESELFFCSSATAVSVLCKRG